MEAEIDGDRDTYAGVMRLGCCYYVNEYDAAHWRAAADSRHAAIRCATRNNEYARLLLPGNIMFGGCNTHAAVRR